MQASSRHLFQDSTRGQCFGPLQVEEQLVIEQASDIGRQLSRIRVTLDSELLVQISSFAHQIFQDTSVRVKSSELKTGHTLYIQNKNSSVLVYACFPTKKFPKGFGGKPTLLGRGTFAKVNRVIEIRFSTAARDTKPIVKIWAKRSMILSTGNLKARFSSNSFFEVLDMLKDSSYVLSSDAYGRVCREKADDKIVIFLREFNQDLFFFIQHNPPIKHKALFSKKNVRKVRS